MGHRRGEDGVIGLKGAVKGQWQNVFHPVGFGRDAHPDSMAGDIDTDISIFGMAAGDVNSTVSDHLDKSTPPWAVDIDDNNTAITENFGKKSGLGNKILSASA